MILLAIHCKLQDLLWEKRLKAADLVRMTGVSKTTIHALYHDRVTKVDFGVVDKVCGALNCGIEDLFSRDPDGLDYTKGENHAARI
jgi:putative transcriptional regulator